VIINDAKPAIVNSSSGGGLMSSLWPFAVTFDGAASLLSADVGKKVMALGESGILGAEAAIAGVS
jgi:hypothetical protein